jgi:hypothetical protein
MHLKSLSAYISNDVTWKSQFPTIPTIGYIESIQCNEHKIALKQIAPINDNACDLVYYENCLANLYAAFKRQCAQTINSDPNIMYQYRLFVDNVMLPELHELYAEFNYSFSVWYNHLTAEQQKEIKPLLELDDDQLMHRVVKIFCKAEKQVNEKGDVAKNRCISALNSINKYVMGPAVYALEQYTKNYKGYCGGKNWEDLAKIFDKWRAEKRNIFGLDVSGFDRGQKTELKKIIYHSIYKIIQHHITHVSQAVFERHAYADQTKLVVETYEDGATLAHGYADIIGQVFSGSNDTTHGNTLAMVSYIRFTMEVIAGVHQDDYDLLCKGDDSEVAVLPHIPIEKVRDAFRKVFAIAKYCKNEDVIPYINHGLGQIMKFLRVGKTTDIDFCSTHVFFCDKCNTHRITRRLERFLTFTPFSNSVLKLNRNQTLSYMQQLHISNLDWMDGLPIFRALNDRLRTDNYTSYNLSGKGKEKLEVTAEEMMWHSKMFNTNRIRRYERLANKIGKDDAYAQVDRIQKLRPCCADSCARDFMTKYNWTTLDIANIERAIYQADQTYENDELDFGFEYNKNGNLYI